MAQLTHSQKRKLATKMKIRTRSPKPIFETPAWERRKGQIQARHVKRNVGEHMRAVKRREEKAKELQEAQSNGR